MASTKRKTGSTNSPVGPIADGGNGGKGLVVIRYKFQ